MDDIEYKFYKDGVMFHKGSCPIFLFTGVISTNDQNFFDFVELIYNGTTLIHQKENGINEWKP